MFVFHARVLPIIQRAVKGGAGLDTRALSHFCPAGLEGEILSIYICMCIYIYIYIHTYTYIYIERER